LFLTTLSAGEVMLDILWGMPDANFLQKRYTANNGVLLKDSLKPVIM
jgi:hypothetical protein